ncbi:hypothetical protein [Marinobacter salexigens]|nr:hypothetical protein [Marinobacter salexigens]
MSTIKTEVFRMPELRLAVTTGANRSSKNTGSFWRSNDEGLPW